MIILFILILSIVLLCIDNNIKVVISMNLNEIKIITPILFENNNNNINTNAIPISISERKQEIPCSFLAERKKVASCSLESPEHLLLSKYLNPNSIVLELGARYGTTACEVASLQNNSGLLLSVESDPSVWSVLAENQRTHNCAFHILQGVVGPQAALIFGSSYGTKSIPEVDMRTHRLQGAVHAEDGSILQKSINLNKLIDEIGNINTDKNLIRNKLKIINNNKDKIINKKINIKEINSENNSTIIPSITFTKLTNKMNNIFRNIENIKKLDNYYFNTLLIDCEGCINNLFEDSENIESLKLQMQYIKTIFLEADMPLAHCLYYCVDYDKWIQKFIQLGFKIKIIEKDHLYAHIKHYVLIRD